MRRIEAIYYSGCILLMFYLFYEGMYIYFDLDFFRMWLFTMPGMNHLAKSFAYLIPTTQVIISVLLIYPRVHLLAFYLTLLFEVLKTSYFIWALLYGVVFVNPYHIFLGNSTWRQEIIFGAGLSIICFIAIIYLERRLEVKQRKKRLRNIPA